MTSVIALLASFAFAEPTYSPPPGGGTVADNSLTYAKLQQVSTDDRLLGLDGTAPGNVEELSLGSGLGMSAANTVGITDVEVTPILAVTSAADRVFYYTGNGTGALATFTATGRAVAASADSAAFTAQVNAATTTTAGIIKIRPFSIPFLGGSVTLTDLAAATTEIASGARRAFADSTNATQVMLVWQSNTSAPSAGSKAGIQCSADQSTWIFADGTTDGDLAAEGPQVTLATTTLLWSTWTTLGATCIGEKAWRIVTDDGNGTNDPTVVNAYALFR